MKDHERMFTRLSCCSKSERLCASSSFFFSELRTEPRALHLLGKHSTTELNPQPRLCTLSILFGVL